MSTATQCLECGAEIPADAMGLCPKCLLKLGLASQFGSVSVADAGTRAPLPPPLMPFDFGEYRVLRLLGRGGMGAVYEAEQHATGRRVALKVLGHTIDTPEMRKRFLREGWLAAAVNHPNSVYIYGTKEIDATPVIAMELVAGGTLKDEVKRRGPLPVRDAVDAVLHIAAGLEAAQAGGVLHRDVKPANCFVAADGAVKVGDFGLSVSTLARADSQLTASGVMLGTPSFAPPEQLRGDELDARADIYSVGATLYYLLTAHAPHEGDNVVNVVASVLDKAPAPLAKFRTDVPAGLAQVVARCLAKKREDRFANYAALRAALLPFSSQVSEPAPLGRRFVAGLIDETLAALPEIVVTAILGVDEIADYWAGERTGSSFLLWLAMTLVYIAYHAVPEGLWGAAPGKALCGLRVVGHDGAAPGIGRAAVRAALLALVFASGQLLALVFMTAAEFKADDGGWFQIAFFPAWWALFVTVRRSNGFAAVQDLVSGTRVVARPTTAARPPLTAPSAPVPAPEAERLGPYLVAGPVAGGAMLAAYDDVLRRNVWIRPQPANAAPIAEARRGLDRSTRLRWIGGLRSEAANWDAFEAPAGQPLLALAPGSQPWNAVRHWLHDLASEIDAAAKDGTLPAAVGLENVWLTADGRAVLLDEPWPVAAVYDRRHLPEQASDGHRPPLQGQDFPVAEPAGMQRFLDAVASHALERRLLPLHARDFLRKLAAGAFDRASFIAGNLQSLIAKSAVVTREHRAVSLGFAPAIFAVLAASFGLSVGIENRRREVTARAHPELAALASETMTYGVMIEDPQIMAPIRKFRQVPAEATDAFTPQITTQFAALIAARHHDLIAAPDFAAQTRDFLDDEQRALALRALREHPQVTPEQLAEAQSMAGPYLATHNDLLTPVPVVVAAIMAGCLLAMAFVNLVSVLAFGTSPGLRLFGLVVVNQAGEPAGRLRLFGRSLAAWLPFLLAILSVGVAISGTEWEAGGVIVCAVLLVCSLAALAYSIRNPARGLPDIVVKTSLVPR